MPTASAGLMRLLLVGDSMTAAASANGTVTSITRTNNVATLTLTTHGRGTGELCRVYNCSDSTFNTNGLVAVTRVDANTITYPSVGPDGSAANISAAKKMQLQSPAWVNDNSYMFWLQSKCSGALKIAFNSGRNGNDSADMLANYTVDAAYASHDAVVIFTGYNDWVGASYTASQVYANVVTIAQRSVGKLVVVVGSIPWTTGGTTANRKEALKYNRMIRNWCSGMPNVRFADAAKYLIDATNATVFSPLSNMLGSDGIHPSPKGGERIAQAIYDAIQYDVPRVSRMVSCSLDNYGNDSTNKNILDTGPWTNSGGPVTGTGGSGTAAAGIGITAAGGGAQTAVASVVSRSDGIGYDQQVVFTPAANNDSVAISSAGYTIAAGRYAYGDKLNFLGELTLSGMSGASIKSIEIYVAYAGGNGYHYLAKPQAANNSSYPAADMTLSIASLVDSVIPDGTVTGISWAVKITAGAAGTALTAKLGRLSCEKV
jgi:lysophospholipase L1-like esterase